MLKILNENGKREIGNSTTECELKKEKLNG